VPTKTDARSLVRQGVSRGRVWTARELMDVMNIPTLTQNEVATIAMAKAEFGGEVVVVRPQSGAHRQRERGERGNTGEERHTDPA